MIKLVPGTEFETNNRTVAATRLQEGDQLLSIQPAGGKNDIVLQTAGGVFLRFPLEEISVLKKNSRGVRGIRLEEGDELGAVYLLGPDGDRKTGWEREQSARIGDAAAVLSQFR